MRVGRSALIAVTVAGFLWGGVPSILKRVPSTRFLLFVGGMSSGGNKGISAFRFDATDASTESLGVVGELADASSLAVHPQNRLLYAVSEVKRGTLSAFAINPKTGTLRLLNAVPSLGEDPCHVLVEPNGWMILVTNCGSGGVVSFRIGGDGAILGSLSNVTNNDPKLKTHPREMTISPDHFFLFGPDPGLGKIFFYRFDPARVIFWPNAPASLALKTGSGPGRMKFRPDGRYAYEIDENTSKIGTLKYDKLTGTVAAGDEVSTLPKGFSGKSVPGDIEIDAAGKFLYVSNRGDDSVAVFSLSSKTGALTQVQRIPTGGKSPVAIKIDPTGRYLLAANRDSGTVSILLIDKKTGALSATGKTLKVAAPASLQFVPAE